MANLIAIGLVLISALMHAFRDFTTKKSLDKQVFVWWYELFSIIFFFPVFLYFLLEEGLEFPFVLYITLIVT